MKEIIDQIAVIDADAFEKEQKNKALLAREKKKLEKEMNEYRDQVLHTAEKKANTLYNQILSKSRNECKQQEDRIKHLTYKIRTNYSMAENGVLNEILDRLTGGKMKK